MIGAGLAALSARRVGHAAGREVVDGAPEKASAGRREGGNERRSHCRLSAVPLNDDGIVSVGISCLNSSGKPCHPVDVGQGVFAGAFARL
jgi:hypothetical protein